MASSSSTASASSSSSLSASSLSYINSLINAIYGTFGLSESEVWSLKRHQWIAAVQNNGGNGQKNTEKGVGTDDNSSSSSSFSSVFTRARTPLSMKELSSTIDAFQSIDSALKSEIVTALSRPAAIDAPLIAITRNELLATAVGGSGGEGGGIECYWPVSSSCALSGSSLPPASRLFDAIILYYSHIQSADADDPLARFLYSLANTGFVLSLTPYFCYFLMHRSIRSQYPIAGIAAVMLAIYNDERSRVAKQSSSLSPFDASQYFHAPLPVPSISSPSFYHVPHQIPRLHSISLKDSIQHSASHDENNAALEKKSSEKSSSSNTPSSSGHQIAALYDFSPRSISEIVHIVLAKYVNQISRMSIPSIASFLLLAHYLTDSALLQNNPLYSLPIGGSNGGLLPLEFHYISIGWRPDPALPQRAPVRFSLSSALFEDFVTGIAYCLCYPYARAAARLSLETVHCRATEELLPNILLQTTALRDSFK